jgi:hypothetical protein
MLILYEHCDMSLVVDSGVMTLYKDNAPVRRIAEGRVDTWISYEAARTLPVRCPCKLLSHVAMNSRFIFRWSGLDVERINMFTGTRMGMGRFPSRAAMGLFDNGRRLYINNLAIISAYAFEEDVLGMLNSLLGRLLRPYLIP